LLRRKEGKGNIKLGKNRRSASLNMMVWNTHGLQDARRRRSLLLKLTAWRHSRERDAEMRQEG